MKFSSKKMVVIGVGLIGGSLIKALKKSKSDIGEIVGVARNTEVLQRAKQSGLIDDYTDDIAKAVINADIVVVATPVGAMANLFKLMYDNLNHTCIVTDAGSVKSEVVSIARENLHDKLHQFVPAHPISGTEHSGLDASFASLFENRYTVITPLDENSIQDIEKIKQMWSTAGSQLLTMDTLQHDSIFAATSHLPHVLVYALVNSIADLPNSDDYFKVVAGGFLDYTRIASSDAVMWRDVCLTNREQILKMIKTYQNKLDELAGWIQDNQADRLFDDFSRAKKIRDALVEKRNKQLNQE